MKLILPLATLFCAAIAAPNVLPSTNHLDARADGPQPLSENVKKAIQDQVKKIGLKKHVNPTTKDPITEWNGLGDSYASGVGSNGDGDYDGQSINCLRYKKAYSQQMQGKSDSWPGDKSKRRFNFGACSGADTFELINKQLRKDSEPPKAGDNRPSPFFGHPQVTLMTIGGNDIDFTKPLLSCILGVPFNGKCEDNLNDAAKKIASDEFHKIMANTIINVLWRGQESHGANPPEMHQLFVNGYVPVFNDVDKGCDNTRWNLIPFFYGEKLTTDLRKKMNTLALAVNNVISNVVAELSQYGVYYVGGWQDAFETHQFCDPAADKDFAKPVSSKTWFWHPKSPSAGEGPSLIGQINSKEFGEALFEALIPDAGTRDRVTKSKEPWKVSKIFESAEAFNNAVMALKKDKNPAINGLPASWSRIFHPKGTALGIQADTNVAAVKDWRQGVGANSVVKCSAGSGLTKKSDIEAAIKDIKAKGDNLAKDNCCTGDKPEIAVLLAQKGTAAISLSSTKYKRCMGCGELGKVLDGIVNTCLKDKSAIYQANSTVPGYPGLYAEVSLGDPRAGI